MRVYGSCFVVVIRVRVESDSNPAATTTTTTITTSKRRDETFLDVIHSGWVRLQ